MRLKAYTKWAWGGGIETGVGGRESGIGRRVSGVGYRGSGIGAGIVSARAGAALCWKMLLSRGLVADVRDETEAGPQPARLARLRVTTG